LTGTGAPAPWTASQWRSLLKRHHIRPDKRLGQNFLFDSRALQSVVDAAELSRDETVLEVGAGIGSLTRRLARSAGAIVAVEFDRRLLPALMDALHDVENVDLVSGDFLTLDLGQVMPADDYCVVANIPYNITSAVIRKLMESDHPPRRIVLTVQAEVAERIVAGPGAMSLLALGVQLYAIPKIVARIPAAAFHPKPKVDSAVIRMDRSQAAIAPELAKAVFRLARAGFGQKRKQLHNSLAHGLGLPVDQVESLLASAGITSERRPQSVSVDEWRNLGQAYLADGSSAQT
jgi:16S rRNA (adenine1518-N6/adenine1519-N6)-dimethyltransferase